MIRRKFLAQGAMLLTSVGVSRACPWFTKTGSTLSAVSGEVAAAPNVLPGTTPLTRTGDLALEMEDGIQQYLRGLLKSAPQVRSRMWRWDYQSVESYEKSIRPHRERLREIIGAVDARVSPCKLEMLAGPEESAEIARGANYRVLEVRWPVFSAVDEGLCGMQAEGLLFEPTDHVRARVVAIPDADWTPEMLAGLEAGVPESAQFARRLAENGCQVFVPMLISREDTFSGNPNVKMTNEPHREWIYRMAFELGRHIVGYEVQKVLAAVDWFTGHAEQVPIGVMGYGEGGLIAFHAGALDPRIAATVVSGYFDERENVWQEPIYRDIWGQVREFGDAEIASLIAPRALIVESCRGPEVDGPPPAINGRANVACPNGKLRTPLIESVRREAGRAHAIFTALGAEQRFQLIERENGDGLPAGEETIAALLGALGVHGISAPGELPRKVREGTDTQARQHTQLNEMVAFTQGLARKSPECRAQFWSRADTSSPHSWVESTRPLRDEVWTEVLGRMPNPNVRSNAHTRLVYETPQFTGYEVLMDVWEGVNAYGILLLPRDIQPGERRPVVVCQHGLEGRAQEVADPKIDSQYYHHFGASLADLGFVVFAPQNPFVGGERFRMIQRMAHPLKLAIYSFVIGQHQQILNWLTEQPFVDPERIGFYGMSYGGKTAIRVSPLLDRYALCICSGDFNEIVWSMTDIQTNGGFMFDDSWDLYEFNFANVVNYAGLACLMVPRPFMVERGRKDGSVPAMMDQYVAFEFEAVKRFYNHFGMDDRVAIEYFDGAHTINGKGTFEFLRTHLHPPPRAAGGVQPGSF